MAGGGEPDGAGRIPFWIHQLVELLLGILLLVEGARSGQHTAVVLALGALLVLLALCSDGPLSAWPGIGRRLHRALDLVAAAVLALSPVVLSLDGVLAIVVLELAAASMVWLAVRTNWRPKPKPRRQPKSTPEPTAAPPSPPVARRLGRLAGRARDAAKAAMASDEPGDGSGRPPGTPPAA
jgi:hypothetical protein